ncbi:nucleotidyl transferase AbiEii/AbiGii toxin family protein [Myxococcota bacterium]
MTSHPLNDLEPRERVPNTVRTIAAWIQQAERRAGVGARRLGWMVASSVVVAALQRARYSDGEPRFLIKGGAYLELRLGLRARATKDLDTLFRGSFDDFLDVLDEALQEPFDGITFQRTEPQEIQVTSRVVKPRRFDIKLQLRGKTWRRITVEVSPDEGSAGAQVDHFPTPSLAHFGLSTPPTTAGLVIDYQVAQKLHACTDPHTPGRPNDRVRDIVDLHILKRAFYQNDPVPASLGRACRDLFGARAKEAKQAGLEARDWPPEVIAYPHWRADYLTYANEVGLELLFDDAVSQLDDWMMQIDRV